MVHEIMGDGYLRRGEVQRAGGSLPTEGEKKGEPAQNQGIEEETPDNGHRRSRG